MTPLRLAVVLGGTGFLGRVIAARFADGFRVRLFSRRAPATSCPFEYQTGDIADRAALRRALEGAAYVLHLASDSLPGPSNEDPGRDPERSLSDGIAVLETCLEAGVRCVLYPSTGGAVYGIGGEEPLDEDAPTDPVSSYGITRLALEKYLALHKRLHGLDHRIL
jgi:UDP-glucose 4-epimerase